MTTTETLGSDFPKRSVVTNLVAGVFISLLLINYLGVGHGAGFAAGILLGSLHLWTWIGLGRQLLGDRDGFMIAAYVAAKLGLVYGGAIAYLMYQRAYAIAFIVGFTMIFFVMIQKVIGRRLVDQRKLRSVP